jgi:Ni,Fe-hydrogenase III component G
MTETLFQAAQELLTNWIIEARTPEANRFDIVLDRENLLAALAALVEARWGYFITVTGLDQGESFELLYHLASGAAVLTLRVSLPRAEPTVNSITSVVPSAVVYERELKEMFGLTIIGLPELGHLFLPDSWPEGVYPLRKDANLEAVTGRAEKEEQHA